ncbi:hypothetical protein [Dyadobacter chenhuakuii]|uniref:Uncharacterized protein n=1 Tax=Dyadobacter chenhuakuii TaxID=2909339 RepID=A0ABY5EA35_9BACT|nr:hypothetical protein [Dyadobacter chenhuakuii]UTM21740.1 hypothetical protein NFI80_25440 [Dyadobacter chenhuakuii]
MKRILLFLSFLYPLTGFCQQSEIGQVILQPMQKRIFRQEINSYSEIDVQFQIQKTKKKKPLVPTLMATGLILSNGYQNPQNETLVDKRRINTITLSFLTGVGILASHRREAEIVVKQYATDGKLISRLKVLKNKNSEYRVIKVSEEPGFLVISLINRTKKPLTIIGLGKSDSDSTMRTMMTDPSIDGDDNGGGQPYDGGTFAAVTISGSSGSSHYIYSNRGSVPNDSWRAGSPSGPGGGSGHPGSGGDGGESSGAPSPEAKKLTREFNEFGANKCEARYIGDHLVDVPLMAPTLIFNKRRAEQYMTDHNMEEANTDGASSENALKHGIMIALNYCSFGEQHAETLGNIHEMCGGINQNPTSGQLQMDRKNNQVGLFIAKSQGCNDTSLLLLTLHTAYQNGSFRDITGNPTQLLPGQEP